MADSVFNILMEQGPNADYSNLAHFRKMLLQQSDTSANQYLNGGSVKKLEILKNILDITKTPELVSIYLELFFLPLDDSNK